MFFIKNPPVSSAMQMGEVGGPSMDPIVEHGEDMDASFWQQLKATVVRNILRKKRNYDNEVN